MELVRKPGEWKLPGKMSDYLRKETKSENAQRGDGANSDGTETSVTTDKMAEEAVFTVDPWYSLPHTLPIVCDL
jgi:hypothetical protein